MCYTDYTNVKLTAHEHRIIQDNLLQRNKL